LCVPAELTNGPAGLVGPKARTSRRVTWIACFARFGGLIGVIIAALMALFRHPSRPKVLFIEELENGLDPRTIGLIVEEIQSAVLSGRQQVVVTTHSPYLLDLFPLDSIVMVEREHGSPTFWRPDDIEAISKWKNKYAPGRMYSTGMFSRGSGG